MNNNENPMDVILNASIDDLKVTFEKMDAGALSSFINVMSVRYSILEKTKDGILDSIVEKATEEQDKTLSDIYGIMSRIENVVIVGKEVLHCKVGYLNK